METITQETLSEKIIEGLRRAATELEKFRLQAALGKAEAVEAYEEAKKKLNHFIHESRAKLDEMKDLAMERSTQIKAALEILQVQLALGKAETKEIFEAQKKKIINALTALETLLQKNKTTDEYYSRLKIEIEKFKIKLEILKLRNRLHQLSPEEEIKSSRSEFSKILSDITKRLLKKEEEAELKWGSFRDEISEAFSHFRKAFVR